MRQAVEDYFSLEAGWANEADQMRPESGEPLSSHVRVYVARQLNTNIANIFGDFQMAAAMKTGI